MDVTALVQQAKETILKDGELYPTLYIEFEDGSLEVAIFADLPETTREKQIMFFGAARKIGRATTKSTAIREALFLVEAWVSMEKDMEHRKYDQPSDDPNRKEHLVALTLQVIPGPEKSRLKSHLQHFEMLRAGSGELMDLLAGVKMDEIHDNLLPYVLAGMASAKYTDDELARNIVMGFKPK